MTQRNHAIITGLSLLLMAVTAGYAYGYAFGEILVKGDTSSTLIQVQNNTSLVVGATIAWVIILALDLIVSWTLYGYYRSINAKKSIVMGLLRVGYSIILGIAIYQLTLILPAADAGNENLVYQCFENFDQLWLLGLTVFGLHLIVLGFLVLEDTNIHQIFGWLLLIGGASYTLISPLKLIYGDTLEWVIQAELVMSVPMALAELALAIWMLIKGGKVNISQKKNS
jgi:hypothetical protein